MAGDPVKRCSLLPDTRYGIGVEDTVGADNRDAFGQCLRDQHAVEWITVMIWELGYLQCMIDGDVEKRDAILRQMTRNERRKRYVWCQLTEADLDGHLPDTDH